MKTYSQLKNVLITKDMKAKICDFGYATDLREDRLLVKKCGTVTSMAPVRNLPSRPLSKLLSFLEKL